MSDKVYRIKPLVWERVDATLWRANTMFGQVSAILVLGTWRTISDSKKYASRKAAQLAAEQWHRERMAVGLVEIQT